jgi:hypothetical protein
MLALGIILVLLAAGAVVAALLGGAGNPATFELGLLEIQTNTLGAFLFGAVTVVLLLMGLGLIRAGVARARRRREERKELNRLHRKLDESPGASTGASTGGGAATRSTAPADPGAPTTSDSSGTSTPPR